MRGRREIGRYLRAGPKLLRLGRRDWVYLFKAQFALFAASREVRNRATGDLVHEVDPVPAPAQGRDRVEDARRIARAVSRAASFGPFRPKCLVRSMALRRLLAAEGIEGATVRVGVRLAGGRFLAHAWVEYGGAVVGDDPEVGTRYLPLSGIQVAEFE